MSKEYKLCTELLEPTPEMLRSWDKNINGEIYLVMRQVLLRCPVTNELVPESQCLRCEHNYGQFSDRWANYKAEGKTFRVCCLSGLAQTLLSGAGGQEPW